MDWGWPNANPIYIPETQEIMYILGAKTKKHNLGWLLAPRLKEKISTLGANSCNPKLRKMSPIGPKMLTLG